jgi:hypothetical protein
VLKSLTPGSLGAAQPKLAPGLVLSTVQGKSVANLHYKERLQAIQNAGRPLTLGFLRIEGAAPTVAPKVDEDSFRFVNPLEGDEEVIEARGERTMGKKGTAKFANQDTEEDSFRFVNPLEGDEEVIDAPPAHVFEGEKSPTEREKHETQRATHTHVDHDEVAPDIESDALVTVIQHLDKVPFFDGMPKKARERCLPLLLSPGL